MSISGKTKRILVAFAAVCFLSVAAGDWDGCTGKLFAKALTASATFTKTDIFFNDTSISKLNPLTGAITVPVFHKKVKTLADGCMLVRLTVSFRIRDTNLDGFADSEWSVSVDGLPLHGPTGYGGVPPWAAVYSADYWICGIAKGTHTIDVRVASVDQGDTVDLVARTMVVQHQ
jgi:hypothetical protein